MHQVKIQIKEKLIHYKYKARSIASDIDSAPSSNQSDDKPHNVWDDAHIHNTINLMLQRSEENISTLDAIKETEGCKKQIKHRVLLVLKRAYHETFEEGIISVDSYMTLDTAVDTALDNDNFNSLKKMISRTFKINYFVRWLYSKCKTSVSQYILMKELQTAIEVGLVFVSTFEVLNDKLNVAPSISESPLLLDIVDELNVHVQEIKQQWLALHELYPEIYNSIQTRHAVQTIIHYEARDVEELFKRGLLMNLNM